MLTSSQQRALVTTHHLSVTANAGSGKTMVLVQRYLDILLSGKARVSEIVAITFTEKAASELRRKVSEGVAQHLAEAENAERKRLEDIREQLPSAIVDTIHSFCSRLLREYPVEAGVDAAFTVLEGVDQVMMLEAAVKETFNSVLREGEDSKRREKVLDVLRRLGKAKVIDIVTTLAHKRELVGQWFEAGGLYTKSDAEVLSHWRGTLSAFANAHLDDPLLPVDIDAVLRHATGKEAPELVAAVQRFLSEEDKSRRLLLFKEMSGRIFTSSWNLRKRTFGDAEASLPEQAARLSGKAKSLIPLIEFLAGGDDSSHSALLDQSRVLLDLYQQAIEIYEDKKAEGAHLDFDDLQIRTRNLLREEPVRRKLGHRFKFIMVDEYQDTNRMQYEILLPLVNGLASGNLFIVGDPKQSIYGFRDADVSVFNQTRNDIREIAGSGSAVVLGESFRPLRDVAAFVNTLFQPLLSSESDVGYESLIRGRQNPASGSVEIILTEKSEEGSDVSEGELIARRILLLRANQHQVFDKKEVAHPIAFSDIAVLLRTRTSLPGIEEAFVRHNIPYLVTGGVGYFQTQGVFDFYNYFRFLLNNDDDTSLFGLLRSPFYNVSDAELFEAGYGRKGISLWRHLERIANIGQAKGRLGPAVAALREDVLHAPRMNVPDLVNYIIRRTDYAGFVAGSSRSEQTFANIEKLKRLARKYEDYGFTTLYDFVARLKRLIEQEPDEGQAAVDVLADAVKVMTIHAAKGLEFPVVFVPSLDRPFRYDKEPYLDREIGLGLGENGDETIPIGEFLRRGTSNKQIAEEKRVFYVACTRARDMLVLSSDVSGLESKYSCARWLNDVFGLSAWLGGQVPKESGATLRLDAETPTLEITDGGFKPGTERHELIIPVLRNTDIPAIPKSEEKVSAAALPGRHVIDPLPPGVKGEIFSASKIRTYVDCPARYYLRYVIGLPDIGHSLFSKYDDEDGDVTIPADLRGRAFHHVMQHVEELARTPEAIRSTIKQFIGQDSLSIIAEPSLELDELTDSILKVVQTSFWKNVEKGTDHRTEFTLMSPFGDDFLTGTIDMVYTDADGVLHVIDYKTDSISPKEVPDSARSYEAQLQFYVLLAQRHFSAERVRGTLFFTAPLMSKEYNFTSTDLIDYELSLKEIISDIRSAKFRAPDRQCSACPFHPTGCKQYL